MREILEQKLSAAEKKEKIGELWLEYLQDFIDSQGRNTPRQKEIESEVMQYSRSKKLVPDMIEWLSALGSIHFGRYDRKLWTRATALQNKHKLNIRQKSDKIVDLD